MIGVEATVMGFGLRGDNFGLVGPELSLTTGVRSGGVGFGAPFSAASAAGFAAPDLPSTSALLAAAISRAVMTSPSSMVASGRFAAGAAPAGAPLPLLFRAWGMLKSLTVGSGTGWRSAPMPDLST